MIFRAKIIKERLEKTKNPASFEIAALFEDCGNLKTSRFFVPSSHSYIVLALVLTIKVFKRFRGIEK